MKHRVFLDANVLFSAAWLEGSALAKLWALSQATLVNSRYALAEAEHNLETEAQRARLQRPAATLTLTDAPAEGTLPAGVELVGKDVPILLAAIEARATHLLTGDRRHFGHLYGRSIESVKIFTPASYLGKPKKRRTHR